MKTLIRIFPFMAFILLIACEKDNNNSNNNKSPYTEHIVALGSNSASDVYYSLADSEVSTVTRSDWDIAFSVFTQSATVLINEGAGVELYCVGDTNSWESIDDNTISGLAPRFNDESNWDKGAFNQNADTSNPFNFGWGHYSMDDHNVYGDSIYVIKLSDGTFRKFFYRERVGASSTHILSWANIDGSDPVNTSVVASQYTGTRNFIQYSIVNRQIVEAEPLKDTWDLLFTRYITRIPSGPSSFMNYQVTGVLSAAGVKVAKVTGVPPAKALDTDAAGGYSGQTDAVGFDWKVSDPVTHEVSLADSVSYFVKLATGKKYQLYFTNYGGIEAGTITIKVKTVE